MSKKTLITVIIPAKDRPLYTSQAINSVINQKLSQNISTQIIVIDNNSKTPLKVTLGKTYPQVRFITSRGHNSPSGSRNYGLKYSKGEYVAFLDNDDQWFPHFLSYSLAAIQQTNSPASLCLTFPYIDGPYPLLEVLKLFLLNLIKTTSLVSLVIFNQAKLPKSAFYLSQISHMLFRSKSISNLKFNQNMIAAEDWDFFVNTTHSKPLTIVPRFLVKFRYSWNSNTNSSTVRAKKWQTYQNLHSQLPNSHKSGIFSKLFLLYIHSFKG